MRVNPKNASLIAYMMLAVAVLLVQACGQPVAKDQGCPSDTFLANAEDTINATPSTYDYVGQSYFGFPFPGGTIYMTPIEFSVTAADGSFRPNICLVAYTGDTMTGPGPYWYSDDKYLTPIFGSGVWNARTLVTDDTGVARVFWSSATLPPALPALITGGTPTAPTGTAGKDQSGVSFINVQSGSKQAQFDFNWTVKGEPAP